MLTELEAASVPYGKESSTSTCHDGTLYRAPRTAKEQTLIPKVGAGNWPGPCRTVPLYFRTCAVPLPLVWSFWYTVNEQLWVRLLIGTAPRRQQKHPVAGGPPQDCKKKCTMHARRTDGRRGRTDLRPLRSC
eukprot:2266009-Amphidinium_carterae.1